jgi:hypothetical protein
LAEGSGVRIFATEKSESKGIIESTLPTPHTRTQNATEQKRDDLNDLDDNFAPGMTGQNLVVRTEHVVKLMHRIDDRLDLAYIKEYFDQRTIHV